MSEHECGEDFRMLRGEEKKQRVISDCERRGARGGENVLCFISGDYLVDL